MRVLIAEDETIIRLDLRGILEKAGFEVCGEARDGRKPPETGPPLDVVVTGSSGRRLPLRIRRASDGSLDVTALPDEHH